MTDVPLHRRDVLKGSACGAAITTFSFGTLVETLLASGAVAQTASPFAPDHVKQLAEQLAKSGFAKPKVDLPEPFSRLSYDQYRDIRFRTEKAVWRGEKLEFELQFFPMGWLYDAPVDIWVVEGGSARQLSADGTLFSMGSLLGAGPQAAPFGFSGFRIHGPLNRAEYLDEVTVFQGASYLRALGRGQNFGVSARGLAVNTARPGGEEFPLFRAFWIEKPAKGQGDITVHALLDSPSVTGAYKFLIRPGDTTAMDVDATLFLRRDIEHAGIAPLTSMFLHGPASHRVTGDFRPAVYDNEGLAILNGWGERIWRPLCNPKTLQTSAFVDKDVRGFGLVTRNRDFELFQDLEARYERRPTLWIEPLGQWGDGFVELIEIPVDVEIHDNIVAYWRPATKLAAGTSYNLQYRMHWGHDVPAAWNGARVKSTRTGVTNKPGAILFVVDFEGVAVAQSRELPAAQVGANPGQLANVVVQRNPEVPGVRVSFELNPGDAELVELRLSLKLAEQTISESWLYRWTRS